MKMIIRYVRALPVTLCAIVSLVAMAALNFYILRGYEVLFLHAFVATLYLFLFYKQSCQYKKLRKIMRKRGLLNSIAIQFSGSFCERRILLQAARDYGYEKEAKAFLSKNPISKL